MAEGQNRNFVNMTKSRHQPQLFHLPRVFGAGGHQIDPGGVDGGVAQHVRQLYDVAAGPIERRGKQMAEIMGKYLGVLYPGGSTQLFQLCPDLPS